MRDPAERLADLRAQRAANLTGERRVAELIERHGADGLAAGMGEILDYSERRTRAALAELADGDYEAEDVLEGGPEGSRDLTLRVRATIAGDELRLDFAGSAEQVEGNLNCPLSVTKSAAFFAVRVLTDPEAPALGGRAPPRGGRGPGGLPAERARARRRRRRQRRDLQPGRRPGARGSGAARRPRRRRARGR